MAPLISGCILLLTLGCCVFGQNHNTVPTPDTLCRTDFRYRDDHIYPDDWHLIVDSYDFEDLFGGSRAVWELRDVDGDGTQWNDAFGGTCQLEIGLASCSGSSNQDNWFFTSYNSYNKSIEVILTATFRWSGCQQSTNCDKVAVYRYDTDGPVSEAMQTNPMNYVLLTGDITTSRLQHTAVSGDTTVELQFTRPVNSKGFYLGFRDTGVCGGQITRFQTYYRIAPPVVEGFLSCPEVPLAGGRTTSSSCVCADNSGTTGNLRRMCSSDGVCSDLPDCQCSPGYNIVSTSNPPVCQACPVETFKAELSNETTCRPCPTNSEARNVSSAVCTCISPYIRNPGRPGDNCTESPSPPRLFPRPPAVDGTAVTLCWTNASNNGGLSDLHYNIYVNRLTNRDENYTRVNNQGIFDNGRGDRENAVGTICYEVTGLDAETSYSILITSANGATGDPMEISQDLERVDGQYLAFFVTTGEGGLRISEAVAVTFFVTAIIFSIVVAVTTALLVWWLCVRGKGANNSTYNGSTHNHSTSSSYSSKSSDTKRPPPAPPRTKI